MRDEKKNEKVYEGPAADIVPKLMRKLIEYLNSPRDRDHLLISKSQTDPLPRFQVLCALDC